MKPFILSIAGYDASAGAGVLADVKTAEQCGVYAFAVTTCITYQNDRDFQGVDWLNVNQIIKQIELLLQRFEPQFIKIGLIENFEVLAQIVDYLKFKLESPMLIWDTVLKASAGFEFHSQINRQQLSTLLQNIYLVTPNLPEFQQIFPDSNLDSKFETSILLKGGHGSGEMAQDILITENQRYTFENQRIKNNDKHGTGCILSSAIASFLALGFDLPTSCQKAKKYITNFISSNETLLGYHNPIINYEL